MLSSSLSEGTVRKLVGMWMLCWWVVDGCERLGVTSASGDCGITEGAGNVAAGGAGALLPGA